MLRRELMQAMGVAATAGTSDRVLSQDGDRHKLETDTRSANWIQKQLERVYPVGSGVNWTQLDSTYRIPKTEEAAERLAKSYNALIDAPYRPDEFDCNDASLQLASLFGRAGMNVGALINDDHMWSVLVAADRTVIEWEPQLAQDVSTWSAEKYKMTDGQIIL